MSFQGKCALITGSSRGIGRGIALKLAEKGARVAVHYFRNEAAAQHTLEKVRAHGSDGFIVQADVCRPDEIRRIFDGNVKMSRQSEAERVETGSQVRRARRNTE